MLGFFVKLVTTLQLKKILLGAHQKTGQLHFARSHLYEKMSMLVVLLWIYFSRQVGYMLEQTQIIWNCSTYRTKIVNRKK